METSYSFGNVWPRGLAFSPDGSHLFAVTGAPFGGGATVQLNIVAYGPAEPPVTVQAPSATFRFGAGVPGPFVPAYAGLPAGTSPATPATCTSTPTTASAPGTYPVTCSGAADPDHWFAYSAGTLTITPAPVLVQGPTVSASFGAPVPASFPPAYSGLVNNAPPATPATCTTSAAQTSAPGAYPITCSGAVDPDYSFTYAGGILTVARGATRLVAAPLTSSGMRPTATLTRTLDGAPITGATITFTMGRKACTGVTNAGGTASCKSSMSLTSFTAAFAGNADYLASSAPGSLS